MKTLSKITVVNTLRYMFLLLCLGWGILTLLNLSANLGIFNSEPIMRGWVSCGPLPGSEKLDSGPIELYTMGHKRFAVIKFDSMKEMLQGMPLLYLLVQVLCDLAIVLVFYQMTQIFRSLDFGEVFRSNTMQRMRIMAYTALGYALLTFLGSKLLATYINDRSADFDNVSPAVHYERVILGVLTALIISALVKAFELGKQLQQEQDLTI